MESYLNAIRRELKAPDITVADREELLLYIGRLEQKADLAVQAKIIADNRRGVVLSKIREAIKKTIEDRKEGVKLLDHKDYGQGIVDGLGLALDIMSQIITQLG